MVWKSCSKDCMRQADSLVSLASTGVANLLKHFSERQWQPKAGNLDLLRSMPTRLFLVAMGSWIVSSRTITGGYGRQATRKECWWMHSISKSKASEGRVSMLGIALRTWTASFSLILEYVWGESMDDVQKALSNTCQLDITCMGLSSPLSG